jgi:hypothetical protein
VWHLIAKEVSAFNDGDLLVRIDDAGSLEVSMQTDVAAFPLQIAQIGAGQTYHLCIRADNKGYDAYFDGVFKGKITKL